MLEPFIQSHVPQRDARFSCPAAPGQSAILITAILCMVVLLIFSVSLGRFSQQAGQRNISSKKVLQSYYVAMMGIQEALGTRMVPRSNQLNYRQVTNATPFLGKNPNYVELSDPHGPGPFPNPNSPGPFNLLITPYYNFSGLAFTSVARMDKNYTANDIFGVYRYIVVGGDSARKGKDGNYYATNNVPELQALTQPFFFPIDSSPFYVISNGITCIPAAGGAAVGSQIVLRPYPQRPVCRDPQFMVDETNIVVRAQVELPEVVGTTVSNQILVPDRISHIVTSRPDPRRANKDLGNSALLPINEGNGGAFIPGVPYTGSGIDTFFSKPNNNDRNAVEVNFEDLWKSGFQGQGNVTPQSNARLTKILVYNAAQSQRVKGPFGPPDSDYLNAITVNQDIAAPASLNSETFVKLNKNLPAAATIRLYFNGPVDFRSFYRYETKNCVADPNQCNIQLTVDNSSSVPAQARVRDFNFVPLLPGSTSVILTPSFVPGALHNLRLSGLRGFNGVIIPPITIQFRAES